MTYRAFSIFAIGAALSASPAAADVTAQEVWDHWKSLSAYWGQAVVAGSEDMDGDTLVLSDVTSTFGADDQSVESTIEWIRMRELGDGTVEVTMAPEQHVTGNVKPEDGEAGTFDMTLTYAGNRVLASGTPERLVQSYTMDSVELTQSDFMVDGEPMPFSINLNATALAGTYVTETLAASKLRMSGDATAESVALKIEGTDPENGSEVMMDISATGIGADFLGDMVNLGVATNPFASGANMRIDASIAKVATVMDVKEDDEVVHIESTGDDATFGVAISPDEISYATSSGRLDYTFSASEMPFPDLKASVGASAFKMLFPASKSDQPEDFELLLSMRELVIDDRLWLMLDPGNSLDHGPATLVVDLAGKAKMLVDMMTDPEAMENLEGPPGELEALTLRDLQVTAAGAELTGAGDFTFDNTKTEMLDGFPQPEGAVDLKLVGGNALLDNLVKMGLIPEDEMMGMRMMMAMFTVPGDAPDTLTSRIEVTGEGKILANGQPLN